MLNTIVTLYIKMKGNILHLEPNIQGWEVSRYSLGRTWIEAIFRLCIDLGEPNFGYLVH